MFAPDWPIWEPFCRYMKYLYPFECEKKGLSSPGELQAAIDSNRREGRRPSYTNSLYRYSPSPSSTSLALLSSPTMQTPPTGHNGLSTCATSNLKRNTGTVWHNCAAFPLLFCAPISSQRRPVGTWPFLSPSKQSALLYLTCFKTIFTVFLLIRWAVHPCVAQPTPGPAAAACTSCVVGAVQREAGERSWRKWRSWRSSWRCRSCCSQRSREEKDADGGGAAAPHAASPPTKLPGLGISIQPYEPQTEQWTR